MAETAALLTDEVFSDVPLRTPAESHAAMKWAQRLKRVFDIEVCSHCGGSVRVIASIEDQVAIDRILDHLRQKEQETPTWLCRCHQPERHPGHGLFSLGKIPAQQ
jgi:hypothetical protein